MDYYKEAMHRWATGYAARKALLGTGTTIIPLVDPTVGAINSVTGNTRMASAGLDLATTWSTAPSGMATPFAMLPASPASDFSQARLHGPGMVPGIKLNGTSERLTVPDNAGWTNTATNPWSLIVCMYVTNQAANQYVIAKGDANDATKREWELYLDSSEKPTVLIYDESVDAYISLVKDTAVSTLVPIHFAFTHDGGTTMGASVFYVNGVSVAATAGVTGVFVSMEDLASVVTVGATGDATPTGYFGSTMYGALWGPTFVDGANLGANVVKEDYLHFAADMGLK